MIKSLIKHNWFLGLGTMLLFLLAAEMGLFDSLDRKAYDLGLQFSSSKEPHEDIVIIAIDDKSILALGAWPWSRNVLAETTKQITRGDPRIIGYNLPLDGAQVSAGFRSLGELRKVLKQENKLSQGVNRALRITELNLRVDDKLAASFKAAGRVVLAMPYIEETGAESGLTPALPGYMERFSLPGVSINNLSQGFGWPTPSITRAEVIFPPLEVLTLPVGAVGVVDAVNDFGGEPLMVKYGSEVLPSFALMMAARSKGLSSKDIESNSVIGSMLGEKKLHADYRNRLYPRYYKSSENKPAFPVYSLIEVLDGSFDVKRLRDKIIILGITSMRGALFVQTPGGELIPETIASAHTVSSILNNDQYRLPEWAGWVQRVLIVLAGLYLILVQGRLRSNTAFFLTMFLVLMVFNAHFLLMSVRSLWLPMMSVVAMLLFSQLVTGTRQLLGGRLHSLQADLSSANRQLGLSLQAQGYLDQAFEKLRHTHIDDSVLGHIYNLGLDYERKRQFNKAGAVFKFILQHDPNYNDVSERLSQNEQAANTVNLQNTDGPGANLISSQNGVQKPKLGRYQIDREIGRGAMGMVYLGHDDKIGRTVAIKTMMLSSEIEEEERDQIRTRFFREAEAAGRLDHPNIVTVYDVGEEQDLAYIAMDFLKGKDLSAYTSSKTLLPVSQVFGIISSVALALDYAHQQRVVHRDIKPANIIYDQEKYSAKITDFGVACLTDASKTKTGTVIGSPYYMAPEQLAGKKVDGRADLFSLGVTMYQMLCGVLPFNGDSIANLMYNIANEDHPDIRRFRSDLPNCVTKLVNIALQKEATKRFQSGKQMAIAMKSCQQHIREMEAA